jgi:hypothetical protein
MGGITHVARENLRLLGLIDLGEHRFDLFDALNPVQLTPQPLGQQAFVQPLLHRGPPQRRPSPLVNRPALIVTYPCHNPRESPHPGALHQGTPSPRATTPWRAYL